MNATKLPDLAELALDRWTQILKSLGIDESLLVNIEGPCPRCGGRTKFRFKNEGGRGTFWCNDYQNSKGNGYGSGFQLIEHVFGVSSSESFKMVREVLHGFDGREIKPQQFAEKPKPQEQKKKIPPHVLKSMWMDSTPLEDGVPAAEYLKSRGLDLPVWPSSIRYNRKISYTENEKKEVLKVDDQGRPVLDRNGQQIKEVIVDSKFTMMPAMIAAITDSTGRCIGLHRTYLEGNKKASVSSVKKALGEVVGGAIRLFKPMNGEIAIAEGIETALAFWQLTGMACWSTISTSGMKNFIVPEGITSIVIAADNDKNDAGIIAAHALKKKAEELGIKVKITMPAKAGQDFLDYLNEKRK